MAIDPAFRAMVEEKLGAVLPVRIKAMFGGLGIYSGDLFFAIADGERVYLKVSDLNRADFLSHGLTPFQPDPNRPETMSYYPLPEGLLDDPAELTSWVDKALEVASQAKRKKK